MGNLIPLAQNRSNFTSFNRFGGLGFECLPPTFICYRKVNLCGIARIAVNFKYWDGCIDPTEMEETWGIPEVRTEWLDGGESRGRRVHLSRDPDGQPYLTQTEMKHSISLQGRSQDQNSRGSNFKAFINGKFCQDPNLATVNDFFLGLQNPENTANSLELNVTSVNMNNLPRLNTVGIILARIDFAPYGLNPPHTHPRATEILVVLEGTLHVDFVTSNTDNCLFTKVLNKGDVFVFPVGLIHFQLNVGKTSVIALASLSSQNIGVIIIAKVVFGSNPLINPDVLTKTF
ncbi:Germin-like protein subfamily 1 member 19 [Morella rubra]|uniref:Germin-like protein n=1 Tax=Morella rubra TaxID=262757 RepID=A0A6A1V3F4_9ROSI|nr:Germin-like protein subfamily 1 member 19 [Morella rubra]